jgi:hypothetical protein
MIFVYRLPARLSDGFCFGGGRPITFQNVDWFNGYDGVTREAIESEVRGKVYAKAGGRFLVLSPDNDITFTIEAE